MMLDPTRHPFDEAEPNLPNRLPALANGRSCATSSGSGSAPPTRGTSERTLLSPLRLPSPPRTDPPRRIRRKKKGSASTACLIPAMPDSPLPLPPSMVQRVVSCPPSQPSDKVEEFPPPPACDAQHVDSPLFACASMLEDLDVVCVHAVGDEDGRGVRSQVSAVGGPDKAKTAPVRVMTPCSQKQAEVLERQISLDRTMDSVQTQKPVQLRHDVGIDGVTSDFLAGFVSSSSRPTTRDGVAMSHCSASAAPESVQPLLCPDMPSGLLRARTDCDYWDQFSQASARSRAADSVDGAPMLCHKSIGGALSSFSPPRSPKPGKIARNEGDETTWSLEREDVIRGGEFSWVRGELVGRGSLGSVWKALDRSTGQLMAVKEVIIDTRDQADDRFRNALQNEIDLYKDLEHPHIVRYLGNDYLDGRLFIYLEYMPGGSIAQVLSQFGPLDEPLIARYARGLLEGLQYLHSCNPPVLHRDIKGANILVGLDRMVKLSDFGCSKRTEGTMVHTLRGSIPWMAPEVMRQSGYGRKADVWSLGCVLIEMSTAIAPWGTFDNHLAAMVRIAMSEETPPVPGHLSRVCQEMIALCTRRAPEERPGAFQLLAHEFVAGALEQTAMDDSWGN